MANYFDAAQANNDQTKAAMLQAIATQGSGAKAAFDQAQQQISAQRAQALAAAVAEAAQRGAPQAVQDQTTATVSQGYDRRLADLASAQASNAGSLANISARGGTYLDQATAAIPALRARQDMANTTAATSVANRLATLKAQQDMANQSAQRQETQFEQSQSDRKAAQQAATIAAQQAAQDRQDRLDQQARVDDLQLQIAQTNAGKAQSSADAASTKSQTASDAAAAKAAAKQQQAAFDAGQSPPQTTKQIATIGKIATAANQPGKVAAGANYALPAFGTAQIETAAAHATPSPKLAKTALPGYTAGQNIGLNQAAVDQLVRSSTPIVKGQGTGKGTPFDDAIATFDAARAAGGTAAQANAALAAGLTTKYGHDFPQVRALVTAMYGG